MKKMKKDNKFATPAVQDAKKRYAGCGRPPLPLPHKSIRVDEQICKKQSAKNSPS